MKYTELIHTSDIHLGAFSGKNLENASLNALEEISYYTIENKYKYLVIAGDLFEQPRLENYELLINLVRLLKNLRNNNVYVLATPGSHDHSITSRDTLTVLSEADLIKIPKYEFTGSSLVLYPLELNDIAFYSLPGLRNNIELKYLREKRVLFKDIERVSSKKIVLVAHTSVEFAGYKPEDFSSRYGEVVIASEEVLKNIPSRIDYIALGHIHFPIPLFDEAKANIVYPGTPVGRDKSDLYETIFLAKKYSRKRRFLAVDLSGDKPFVKSIWSDFNIYVDEYSIVFNKIEDFTKEVFSKTRDMNGKFNALLLKISSVKGEELGRILSELRIIEKNSNVAIFPNIETIGELGALTIDLSFQGNIEDLEREALKRIIEKTGLKISIDKLIELMNKLGRSVPENVSKKDFYKQLFKDIEKILEEIYSE